MFRSNERGMAIVMAMFMTLIVSALGASMAFVARTETLSTQSYTTMAQTRYAAESGLAAAANYLLSSQYAQVAPGTAADALTNYTTSASPYVLAAGQPVLLSTVANDSNYPVASVIQNFGNSASGTLTVSNGTVEYGARARLLAMRQFNDALAGGMRTLQTWEITGVGSRAGSGSAAVEVTAIIERQTAAAFRYGAFATDTGCTALSFEGGARTGSYNSSTGGTPVVANNNGNVGTNGNLGVSGSTTQIYGTLSTPRSGVGSCTANNVTAATIQGNGAQVHGGLIELPQVVDYPTPPAVTAPTTGLTITKTSGCSGLTSCTSSSGVTTITPTPNVDYVLGNVSIEGQGELVLSAGTYVVNSINVAGNSKIRIAGNGPVFIKVAGQSPLSPNSAPITIAGGTVSNTTYQPQNLQFTYAGQGDVYIGGGSETSALVYAPRAYVELTGNSEFFGALVGGRMRIPGSAQLLYDRNLNTNAQTAGNPVMSTFTWQTF